MIETKKLINKDKQIIKFSMYGLLKNLKFFEPYLLIYLMSLGLNLFKIGTLYSIREIIVYLFEVPSGLIADNYGKKKELKMCFVFYIISFALFFFGINYSILVIAMVFFGLGDAFRSGTHKAMILAYLEQKNWFQYKAYVYGRTRSFSLIGSALSALVSIIFVLNLPNMKWIFLICILPYIADFLLISSYPNSLDERHKSTIDIKEFFIGGFKQLASIFKRKELRKVLVSSSLYDSIFKCTKDYIQPILQVAILASLGSSISTITAEKTLKIWLGIIYAIFYVFSSFASKNVHKLSEKYNSQTIMNISFDITAVLAIVMALGIKNNIIIVVVFIQFILYLFKNARRPLVVDVLGEYMHKKERATVLSVESQFRSFFTIALAPLFGFIADNLSLTSLFIIIGVGSFIINRVVAIQKFQQNEKLPI